MRNAGLDEAQAGIKIAGRNINNLRYADYTSLMVGDAFALRSKYAMIVDFKKEPPFFKISDTHYAATWLLDPRAPKVEMPKIVKTRIEASLKAAKEGGLE